MIATSGVIGRGPICVTSPTSQSGGSEQSKGTRPSDAFVKANAAVKKLQLNRAGADTTLEEARKALDKLGAVLGALADGIESAMSQVLKVQSKSSSQNAKASEGRVKAKYDKLEKQTEARRQAIRERVEAEGDKSFWDKLLNVFDSVGKCVVGAAAGCVGGIVGIIGGALLISSVIVANTVQNRAGGWVAAGLAAAGGACLSTLGGLIAEHGLEQVEKARKYIAPALALPKSSEEKKVLEARAKLQSVNTEKARLESQAQEARDDLKETLEGMIRSLKQIAKVFEQQHATQKSAAEGVNR